tara:strand:- start:20158 stop:21369 length:1212 start_codon:yes stop_codon:yes gene_type:complete
VKYELQLFDYIVNEYFNSKNNRPPLKEEEFRIWAEDLEREEERIKQSFMMLAFSEIEDKIIERQIQLYQQKLILISNHISQQVGYLSIEYELQLKDGDYLSQLGLILIDCITALLTFIEKHFTKYFSQDSQIPTSYFINSQNQLRNQLVRVKELGKLKKIDSSLLKIINHHINTFIDNPKNASYRKLIYCKTFLEEIETILSRDLKGIRLEKQFISNLLYLNFNVFAIYNYISLRIKKNYQSKSTYREQLLLLQLFKKLINQSQVKPDFEFNQGVESLKASLINWVNEEIFFFKERKQLAIKFNHHHTLINRPVSNTKIYSKLSVGQLAYLMKLLANSNIIAPENTSKLVEFISNNFSTSSQKDISLKSLRNKIYSPENTTIENVQEIMETLVEKAEKDKSLN